MLTSSEAKLNLARARQQRLQADLILLTVALIWGSAFVVQRLAAAQGGVYTFNGARFLLAARALTPLARLRLFHVSGAAGLHRRTLPGAILAGCILAAGAGFQQAGLKITTAGNAGFITGLYVVWIPIFMSVFWRQKIRPTIWIAALMSAGGLYLLSASGPLRLNRGDALELVGAVFWALHVIVTDRMVKRMHVAHFVIAQYAVCALINLVIGAWLEPGVLPQILANGWMIAYAGLLSVGVGYTLQAVGQRVAPPADAAIILSMEAVFAATAGWFFLGETLTPLQMLGCAIMLGGMLLSQSALWNERSLANERQDAT
jgi:drug/metabolite transporter (DMT)-like permease